MARAQELGTYSIKLKRQISVFKRAGMQQIADGVANVYSQLIKRSFLQGAIRALSGKKMHLVTLSALIIKSL